MIKNDINSSFKGVIFIIGFMASGKTSIGRLLANRLNIPFIDLDTEIQIGEGKSISEIFEKQGEEYFRQKESIYLRNIPNLTTSIVSTGGGTPIFNDNMSYINSIGMSIYLDVPFESIWKRLKNKINYRPLASIMDLNMLNSLYDSRVNYYNKALKVFIPNEQDSLEDQIEYILKLII
ncbi:MAG TPA: shikimate kinase [Saprospiraceae bacterium]|nr:shikimate kinase [Saprospiraceae bacterium]